nr:hypothetical protein BaRGS_016837 [Batillaria attramentaria]
MGACKFPPPFSNFTMQGYTGLWYELGKVDYTVIYLDDEFAIEYDCSTLIGLYTNYCIHIMARHPQADPQRIQELLSFAEGLGLNTANLDFQHTRQDGCCMCVSLSQP